MAVVQVEVYAKATIFIEEEYLDGYSDGDFLEAADNSFDRWQLISVVRQEDA